MILFQAAMCRLRATRVTVSLPYLHKKLDAFGKNHDQEIKNCVKMESERLELRQKVSPEKIEEDSVSGKIEGIQETQSPSNSKGIDDIMKSVCQQNRQISLPQNMPQWKLTISPS